jgi:hypothetical protein
MKNKSNVQLRVLLLGILGFSFSTTAQSVAGPWEGKVSIDGLKIPFQIEIAGGGPSLKGAFLNGDQKVTSTGGHFENGTLVLNFDEYAEKLQATLKDAQLTGTIEDRFGPGPRKVLPFEANLFVHTPESVATDIPSIDGIWEIENKSPKGELAWRFIVHQSGSAVSAAILRVDGDTGSLTGHYEDGKFQLSHFSGERPYLIDVTPQSDGRFY